MDTNSIDTRPAGIVPLPLPLPLPSYPGGRLCPHHQRLSDAITRSGLPTPLEVLRAAAISRALHVSMADVADLFAYLSGVSPYEAGSGQMPEVVASRLAALDLTHEELTAELGTAAADFVAAQRR